MNALIVKSALDHLEFSTIIAIIVVITCAMLACQISMRRPLYYNLFVVEMHTWTTRRMVQVLHLGQEFNPAVPWDRLVQRMRARAPRVTGEQRVAISDTNIVIQSPNTVIDSPAPARSPDIDLITLWDIEMPPPNPGHVPDASRDSQYAAAAAIAILARGDDASLRSRVFQNSQNRSSAERTGLIPNLNRLRNVNPPLQEPQREHDYVTTDVTYTTPSISLGAHHQISTRMSDVTETSGPRNEVITVREDDNEEDVEEYSDTEDASTDEEGQPEQPDEVVPTPPPREEDPSCNGPIEIPVVEGPSEGKILIRLKFMNDTERDTYASLSDTVAKFKLEHFTDITNKVVRLIYRGQLLRDDQRTLENYGLQAGSVMHCHISTVPYQRPRIPVPAPSRAPARRRPRAVPVAPTVGQHGYPNDAVGELTQQLTDELARRRAAQDRNVGQIYLLLSTMVPILSGIGLAFFRPDRMRDLFRPATLLTISHWVCNLLVDNGLLDQDDDEQESHLQTSTLFWIFGGQMFAVSIFFYYFPDVFDRVGFSIFIIVFLYFVFVVYSRQRRRQPDADAQNELDENQIIQESISLL